MQLVFFRVAFFVLMGLAALSLMAIATMFGIVFLKALWLWLLQTDARIAKTGHI